MKCNIKPCQDFICTVIRCAKKAHFATQAKDLKVGDILYSVSEDRICGKHTITAIVKRNDSKSISVYVDNKSVDNGLRVNAIIFKHDQETCGTGIKYTYDTYASCGTVKYIYYSSYSCLFSERHEKCNKASKTPEVQKTDEPPKFTVLQLNSDYKNFDDMKHDILCKLEKLPKTGTEYSFIGGVSCLSQFHQEQKPS